MSIKMRVLSAPFNQSKTERQTVQWESYGETFYVDTFFIRLIRRDRISVLINNAALKFVLHTISCATTQNGIIGGTLWITIITIGVN